MDVLEKFHVAYGIDWEMDVDDNINSIITWYC